MRSADCTRMKEPPEVLTADAALVSMCLWMRGLQADLTRAVADLYAEVDQAHGDVVTINGNAYMRFVNLIPLHILKCLTLDHAADPRFSEARKVYGAVERGDWFEIDGAERAGLLLNGEEVNHDAEER